MKLHRFRTHAGFVYFSHRDSAQAEWKVERDYTVPFTRYTVCRLQTGNYQGKRVWADWYVEHDALTLKDARLFIQTQMDARLAAHIAGLRADFERAHADLSKPAAKEWSAVIHACDPRGKNRAYLKRVKRAEEAAAMHARAAAAVSDDVLVLSGKMITVDMATKMTRS